MSYAIIKTGGKQFAVEGGETLRVPRIAEKAGKKVDVESLIVGEGKDAKIGAATIQATIVGHGKAGQDHRFQKETPQAVQTQTRPPSRFYGN